MGLSKCGFLLLVLHYMENWKKAVTFNLQNIMLLSYENKEPFKNKNAPK